MDRNEKPFYIVAAVLAAVALFTLHAKEADGAELAGVNAGATIETFLEHASTQPVEEVITGTAEVPEDTEVTAVTYEVTEEDTPEQIAEEEYYDTLDLLALCVEAEAGDQDLYGKRLVVDVVLNRVDSPDFPDTIAEVITQVRQFATYENGAIDAAGYHMQPDDYTAVLMELTNRTDSEILHFTAGDYNACGTPAYQYGDHYFSRR